MLSTTRCVFLSVSVNKSYSYSGPNSNGSGGSLPSMVETVRAPPSPWPNSPLEPNLSCDHIQPPLPLLNPTRHTLFCWYTHPSFSPPPPLPYALTPLPCIPPPQVMIMYPVPSEDPQASLRRVHQAGRGLRLLHAHSSPENIAQVSHHHHPYTRYQVPGTDLAAQRPAAREECPR